MMGKDRLIISETQAKELANYLKLTENQVYVNTVKTIFKDLITNYEPLINPEFNGFDYNDSPMVHKNVDNTEITPKQLFDYLDKKYSGVNSELIKQIIRNWYAGDVDEDKILTKNIPLTS